MQVPFWTGKWQACLSRGVQACGLCEVGGVDVRVACACSVASLLPAEAVLGPAALTGGSIAGLD